MARPNQPSGSKKTPSVADSWKRIEAWLDEHLPVLKLSLKPGISKKDLAKFEKTIGHALPEDVRESWLIHDGQQQISPDVQAEIFDDDEDAVIPENVGLIFGNDLVPLVSRDPYPSRGLSALNLWKTWADIVEQAERDDKQRAMLDFDKECTSSPAEAIQCLYANRRWIPLCWLTDSDHIGVDLDPGPNGVAGQVINFGRNEEKKCVLASSWAQFLADFADELEAGNFSIDLEEEYEEFRMSKPRRGDLRMNYKEWSRAKLARKMLK